MGHSLCISPSSAVALLRLDDERTGGVLLRLGVVILLNWLKLLWERYIDGAPGVKPFTIS